MNVSIHKVAAVHHAIRVATPGEAAAIMKSSRYGAQDGKYNSPQSQAHYGYTCAHRTLVTLRAARVRREGSSPF